jgi:hypothetical protein
MNERLSLTIEKVGDRTNAEAKKGGPPTKTAGRESMDYLGHVPIHVPIEEANYLM